MDKRELRQQIIQAWGGHASDDTRHINTRLADKLGISYEVVRQEFKKINHELEAITASEIFRERTLELGRMALRIKERIDYLQKLKTQTTQKAVKVQNHDRNKKLYTYTDVIFIPPTVAELTRITKEQGRLENKLERLLKLDAIRVIAMSNKEFDSLDV